MIIGDYTLVRQLPGGRHGAIWKARDQRRVADVALKQLLGVPAEDRDRVCRAVDRLVVLHDRHLVRQHPAAAGDESLWLVEDWVDGASLELVLAGSAGLTRSQGLGVLRGALLGLKAAHAAGLVHGELSPRSVLIDSAGQPVVVGLGGHLAGGEVAGVGGFASPEAATGGTLSPAADVFSAGAMLGMILAKETLPADLTAVLDRARAVDPAERQPDAAILLAELEPAAERAFGATWWTTTGLSGVVASTVGVAGTTGSAVTGGVGAVTGSLPAGEGALSGAMSLGSRGGAGAVGGRTAIRASRRAGLIIGAAATVVVVAVVGAFAVLRPGQQTTTAVPAAGAQQGGNEPASPSPRAAPDPRLGFTGTYRYEHLVTKSNLPGTPAGRRTTDTWKVKTVCTKGTCQSTITPSKGAAWSLGTLGTGWGVDVTRNAECAVETTTSGGGSSSKSRRSAQVPWRSVFTLTPQASGPSGITRLTGSQAHGEVKKCPLPEIKTQYAMAATITVTKIS